MRMNKTQKGCLTVFIIFLFILSLPFIYNGLKRIYFHNYKESLILGKTSAEVVELYGEFDQCTGFRGEDGLLRSGRGVYIVREREASGFLVYVPQKLFYISFDANGIAVKTGVCDGPWGG